MKYSLIFQFQFIIQQWKFVLFTCKLVYIIILYMTDKREMCKVTDIQWKNKELNDSNRFLYNLKYLVDIK